VTIATVELPNRTGFNRPVPVLWAWLRQNTRSALISVSPYDESDEREHSVPVPAALVRTDEDAGLCLCEPALVGGSYNSSEIERFRHTPLSRYDYRRLIKPDGVPSDDAQVLERVILSPAAQARGQAIVAVYDEWVAAREEAKRASGVEAAEEAFHKAIDVEDAALWDVTATPANTIAGVVAKAHAAQRHLHKSGEATFDSMIEDGRFDVIGPIDLLLVSIASDLLNLSEGNANA
jgi:hypothetical protein